MQIHQNRSALYPTGRIVPAFHIQRIEACFSIVRFKQTYSMRVCWLFRHKNHRNEIKIDGWTLLLGKVYVIMKQ
jgi:hypothetical protein